MVMYSGKNIAAWPGSHCERQVPCGTLEIRKASVNLFSRELAEKSCEARSGTGRSPQRSRRGHYGPSMCFLRPTGKMGTSKLINAAPVRLVKKCPGARGNHEGTERAPYEIGENRPKCLFLLVVWAPEWIIYYVT